LSITPALRYHPVKVLVIGSGGLYIAASSAARSAVRILELAELLRPPFWRKVEESLRTEKAHFHCEFRYPRTTHREVRFWATFGTLSMGRDRERRAYPWVTDGYLLLGFSSMAGLKLEEIFSIQKEPARLISPIQLVNIISFKKRFVTRIIHHYRERRDLILLEMRRIGELFGQVLNDSIFVPFAALDSFLQMIRRLNPRIRISPNIQSLVSTGPVQ
ncbi:MAG: hypothetical protein QXW06_06980, partial [Thermoplasmata archaeon]